MAFQKLLLPWGCHFWAAPGYPRRGAGTSPCSAAWDVPAFLSVACGCKIARPHFWEWNPEPWRKATLSKPVSSAASPALAADQSPGIPAWCWDHYSRWGHTALLLAAWVQQGQLSKLQGEIQPRCEGEDRELLLLARHGGCHTGDNHGDICPCPPCPLLLSAPHDSFQTASHLI